MPFHDGEITLVIRDYVCAQCYEDLAPQPVEGAVFGQARWRAVCGTHGDVEQCGRVTRKSAERLGQRNLEAAREAPAWFPDLFPQRKTGLTPEEIIKQLGF